MPNIASYTAHEVAEILKVSRFTVYDLIKRGDLTAYRVGRKMRIEASDLESYINKSKSLRPVRQQLQRQPAPQQSRTESPSTNETGLIICGQDVILDVLTRQLEKELPHIRVLRNYGGSFDGLLALYRKTVNIATTHLWDSDTDTYNVPYVRKLLPGHSTIVINLLYRRIGFYVAKGNPLKIETWQDLARTNIRFVNRERGSGARVLSDEHLRILGIQHENIQGYDHEELSHLAIASCIARGDADVGVGIEKVALQVDAIDFIPLKKERYDLVIRTEDARKPQFQTLMAILRSSVFRNEVAGMGSYDTSQTGEIMAET